MDFSQDYRKTIKDKLDKTQDLLALKQSEMENLTFEIEVLRENMANILREYADPLRVFDLKKIWRDFNNDTKKFKDKESKNNLSFIERNYFFNKNYGQKLIEIVAFGYSSTAYDFLYRVGKKTFRISIPVYAVTTADNYDQAYYMLFNQDDEHCYTLIFKTHFIEELADAIEKYLEDKEI